jgi:2-polyprenyl-6-methoxyphenol hydroxylase-like FAD-dependent oxidoreductase
MTTSNPRGDHAVVLGASMAGLLAAGVLAETYPRVTVVDRDVMPAIGQHRRGVPQDRHLHVLHPRGAQVLDELFPGLLAQMTAHGAVRGDSTGTGRWQLSGHRFPRRTAAYPGSWPAGHSWRATSVPRSASCPG